ncbi:hypothetical protein EHS13_29555 [Paenibacillus psychroresistens]|uniref:Glycosyl hydrolase family 32 N-terminal domain-containing protein n=2 Tax=Paenibacillus psychroresistens TaxID=1778678 RepID=A0A6B8RV30_9BACL|nr:hypothetical protein EHS13_29555 [Paenibacillus psychroresistens]
MINRAEVEHLATPHKWGRQVVQGSGIAGSFDEKGVDCPFVFYHNDLFHMMYIGFNGEGYQTALATSSNLIDWEFQGLMLERSETSHWDHVGAAGSWILLESADLYTLPKLKKIDNKYWMIYHAYPQVGYESGGAVMGLAWCEDELLLNWHRLEQPVFTYEQGAEWEQGGLYKCCVIEAQDQYWMFYNAKEKAEWPWKEETGVAVSEDLIHWTRTEENPLMTVKDDSFFSQYYSDPCIKHDGQRWVNFGFGFDGKHAQGALALSNDLLHWDSLPEPWIPIGGPGELDEIHAHKSSVIYWQDTLYHFYCACRPAKTGDPATIEYNDNYREFRCITVATSKKLD